MGAKKLNQAIRSGWCATPTRSTTPPSRRRTPLGRPTAASRSPQTPRVIRKRPVATEELMSRTRIVTATKPGTEPATGTPVTPAEHPADRHVDDAQAPQPTGVSRPASEPPLAGLPQLTRILGTVVAPTTLLTSLLFYFGWSHAYYFFDY